MPGTGPRGAGKAREAPQSAQGLVEYALILVLVALVVVLMLIAFGASLRSVYSNISTAIQR